MRITRIVLTALLVVVIATPVMASNGWVDDFLRRYQPPVVSAASTSPVSLVRSPGQLFPTGTIPLSMTDVINMMIDHNLDIRTNRLSPRSSYFQSLVFYRALQPSIRFAGTVNRDTS